MPVQKGLGIVWGSKIDGVTYAAAATPLNVTHTGQSFKRDADIAEHPDDQGEVVGLTVFNERKELTLRCYPSGSTLAAAKTANVLPEIGDKVEVTDADDGELAGVYICVAASKERAQKDKTTFDLTIRQYSTDLSQTVT